jgi:hypothetical protein
MYDENLNGKVYLRILREVVENYLDDMPLNQHINRCFQVDEAPAHSTRVVDAKLTELFEDRGHVFSSPCRFLDIPSKKARLKSYAIPSKNLPERKVFFDSKPWKPCRCLTLRTQKNVTDVIEVVNHKSTYHKYQTKEVLEGMINVFFLVTI